MQFFTADKTNNITGINVSVEFIINLSENPNHFLKYFRNCGKQIYGRWCYILKVNKTRQSEQQSYNAMNQEQAVHHTTLISGYHVSAAKKPHIIGKTKRTSLHLLSRDYNASQFFGMEVQCKILNVHRNYSFKATIFILMMLRTIH